MRWVLIFMAGVVVVDGLVVTIFSVWIGLALMSIGLLSLLLALRWPKTQPEQPTPGWSLGAGKDVTYPDKPADVENVVLPEKVLNLGFLALGGPGSGKSESVAIGFMHYLANMHHQKTDRHHKKIGFSFFCGKGQKDIYQKSVSAGVQFDYFFSSELPYSDSVNLMEGEAHHVIDRLSGLLVGYTQSTNFYADEQRAVLSTIVPLLKALEVPVNLRDLYTLLTVEEAAVFVMRQVQKLDDIEPHIPELADKWFAQSNRFELIRGMLNRLSEFVLGPSAARLNAYQPSISIQRCVQEGKRVYWHFPLSESSQAIATAITDMLQEVAMNRQQQGGEHALYPLIYDDWGDFFYQRFGAMAARCRSVNIPLSFLFQSIAQLDKVSPNFKNELDDTVATKILLRVMGDQTAQFIVQKFGHYDALELSQNSLSDGHKSTQPRTRIQTSELKDLSVGEAYINTLRNGSNCFYKAQFPLIDTQGWRFQDWPKKTVIEQGSGLNLWGQFMGKAQAKKIKQEIHQFIEAQR